jgi:hypothetical protein
MKPDFDNDFGYSKPGKLNPRAMSLSGNFLKTGDTKGDGK